MVTLVRRGTERYSPDAIALRFAAEATLVSGILVLHVRQRHGNSEDLCAEGKRRSTKRTCVDDGRGSG